MWVSDFEPRQKPKPQAPPECPLEMGLGNLPWGRRCSATAPYPPPGTSCRLLGRAGECTGQVDVCTGRAGVCMGVGEGCVRGAGRRVHGAASGCRSSLELTALWDQRKGRSRSIGNCTAPPTEWDKQRQRLRHRSWLCPCLALCLRQGRCTPETLLPSRRLPCRAPGPSSDRGCPAAPAPSPSVCP